MAEHLGPIDEFSGLPLPILPVEVPSRLLRSRLSEEYCRDDLHHAFFPNANLEADGERMLRHSRVQLGNRWAHSRYHEFYDAVAIPKAPERQFALGVLATAGYVPECAVDVSGTEPKRVALSPASQHQMYTDHIFPEQRISKRSGQDFYHMKRGVFFMEHALAQNLDHVRQTLLEEFLETQNQDRRIKLGFFIIDMAFVRAAEPVEEAYRLAQTRGRIHAALPKHPASFIRHAIVQGHQPEYFHTLARRIKEPAGA